MEVEPPPFPSVSIPVHSFQRPTDAPHNAWRWLFLFFFPAFFLFSDPRCIFRDLSHLYANTHVPLLCVCVLREWLSVLKYPQDQAPEAGSTGSIYAWQHYQVYAAMLTIRQRY